MSKVVFNYDNLKCSVKEFKQCVEHFLPNSNELIDIGYRGIVENKQLLKKLLESNPSKYVPSLLEFFFWKDIGDIDEILNRAKCYCGKIGLFDKCHMTYGACCKEHQKDNRIYRSEQATLKKYGVKYNLQNKDTHKKTLEKWDGKSPFSNKEIRQRAKNTIKEKYGVENAMQVEEFCQKSRKTRLDVYGTERANPEKAKATMQERYGVDYFSQSDKFKKLWPKNGGNPEFNNKVREKEYNTRKKNNSFQSSSKEEYVYKLLLTKFDKEDIIRQYTDSRYKSYVCDFYIKSKDLFIEYHGHWGHGGMPYDPNNEECINKLNEWEKRAKKIPLNKHNTNFYYVNINGWCVRDVEKYELAKKNNLNYVVFYTVKQAEDWVSQLEVSTKRCIDEQHS